MWTGLRPRRCGSPRVTTPTWRRRPACRRPPTSRTPVPRSWPASARHRPSQVSTKDVGTSAERTLSRLRLAVTWFGDMECRLQSCRRTACEPADRCVCAEADRTGDFRSLERQLAASLVLVVLQRLGNGAKWMMPQGLHQPGETMRQVRHWGGAAGGGSVQRRYSLNQYPPGDGLVTVAPTVSVASLLADTH